ncbi:MAG: hypothetical protein ACRDYF_20970 [Acidimicrobiia bacterium]
MFDDDEPIGKGSAKVWVLPKQLAATNPCTYWIRISWGWDPSNPNKQYELFLAPGKKFNWDKAHAYGFAKRVYAYNDLRSVPKCIKKNGGWVAP